MRGTSSALKVIVKVVVEKRDRKFHKLNFQGGLGGCNAYEKWDLCL